MRQDLLPDENLLYPVGRDHPDTSYMASFWNGQHNGNQRVRIGWTYYRNLGGLTDEEAARTAGIRAASTPWKRCSELRQWHYISPTGRTRTTQSGCQADVCAMTPEGREIWERVVVPAEEREIFGV